MSDSKLGTFIIGFVSSLTAGIVIIYLYSKWEESKTTKSLSESQMSSIEQKIVNIEKRLDSIQRMSIKAMNGSNEPIEQPERTYSSLKRIKQPVFNLSKSDIVSLEKKHFDMR